MSGRKVLCMLLCLGFVAVSLHLRFSSESTSPVSTVNLTRHPSVEEATNAAPRAHSASSGYLNSPFAIGFEAASGPITETLEVLGKSASAQGPIEDRTSANEVHETVSSIHPQPVNK